MRYVCTLRMRNITDSLFSPVWLERAEAQVQNEAVHAPIWQIHEVRYHHQQ